VRNALSNKDLALSQRGMRQGRRVLFSLNAARVRRPCGGVPPGPAYFPAGLDTGSATSSGLQAAENAGKPAQRERDGGRRRPVGRTARYPSRSGCGMRKVLVAPGHRWLVSRGLLTRRYKSRDARTQRRYAPALEWPHPNDGAFR